MSSRNATAYMIPNLDDDDEGGVNTAPIVLCFIGCVIIEGVCFLAFHYWKKFRRSGIMSHGTCHLQHIPLGDIHFHLPERRPVISLATASDLESTVSDSRSSPPPYSQIVIIPPNCAAQSEEPPPLYEEVVKHCQNLKMYCANKNTQRKFSC